MPFAGSAADAALNDGKVDVVWIIGVAEATAVQSFLGSQRVANELFNGRSFYVYFPRPQSPRFAECDRYSPQFPPVDVQLIGTPSKVLICSDLHPEIVQLLLQTMKEVHSGADILHRSGEYPNGTDTEYPVARTAIDFYKNGPSFLQRHLPLWLSVHVQRAIAVLVTGIAIGFPLFRFFPQLYNWITRRRLFYWYGRAQIIGGFVRRQSGATNTWRKNKPNSTALRTP